VLGGAVARVPSRATAFAHRHHRILANVAAFYEGPDDRPVREAWVTALADTLSQGTNGAYVGFMSTEGEAHVRAAYPDSTRIFAEFRRSDLTRRGYSPSSADQRLRAEAAVSGSRAGRGPALEWA
jgi:hypothetical protein